MSEQDASWGCWKPRLLHNVHSLTYRFTDTWDLTMLQSLFRFRSISYTETAMIHPQWNISVKKLWQTIISLLYKTPNCSIDMTVTKCASVFTHQKLGKCHLENAKLINSRWHTKLFNWLKVKYFNVGFNILCIFVLLRSDAFVKCFCQSLIVIKAI